MDAANRQESYRPVEDQSIGEEHWEHERSPVFNGVRREVTGREPRFGFLPENIVSHNGRALQPRPICACVAKPPMALRVGFAEMPKADVMSYLCVPPVVPVFPTVSSARCRMTLQWENQTCLLEHRRCRAKRDLYRAHNNVSALNYTGQNYEKNAI